MWSTTGSASWGQSYRSSRPLDWLHAVKSRGSLQTNQELQIWRPDHVCVRAETLA
ncbi:hypothetical protein OAD21_01360 [Amylibacter sp.]|nr:hypothetical protein [Amylibacter sp.]